MCNTLRALDFFVSLHLAIIERPVGFEFFNGLLAHLNLETVKWASRTGRARLTRSGRDS